jgi:hypothetical protein
MSGRSLQGTLGRMSKREVLDVPEIPRPDKEFDMLIKLRKQRVERFEQERSLAREEWRKKRAELRDLKERWRQAVQDAKDFWKLARDNFLGMVMTSGQYRKAKAIYGRMKEQASQLYMECQDAVKHCRTARTKFFDAGRKLNEARRQHEKLSMLRDEIRLLKRTIEA